MNGTSTNPREGASRRKSMGKGAAVSTIFVAVGFIGALLIFTSTNRAPSSSSHRPVANGETSATPAPSPANPRPVSEPRTAGHDLAAPASTRRVSDTSTSAQPLAANRDPGQLMEELAQISSSPGPLTNEQAAKFKQTLAELVRQGSSSVPAIAEFLARNLDADFLDFQGGGESSSTSLRASLFSALKQIGGPEAQAAMVQTLQTTALPIEVLELAKNLEQEAPGLYRDQILGAAHDALALASANQFGSEVEVGPAYRVFESYGGGGAGDDIAQTDPANFYNALALASQPQGQGLQSLTQMAMDSGAGLSAQTIATEMIAQLAGDNTLAFQTLMQMAQSGEIRNSVWQKLAPLLAGGQYQAGEPSGTASPANRNYTIVNRATTPDQINQRIGLIDKFLGIVAEDSAAAAALRYERGALLGKLGR